MTIKNWKKLTQWRECSGVFQDDDSKIEEDGSVSRRRRRWECSSEVKTEDSEEANDGLSWRPALDIPIDGFKGPKYLGFWNFFFKRNINRGF